MKPNSLPFTRERRTYCGETYLTVSLFKYTGEQEQGVRKPRKRREKVSTPKQKALNNKNAKRYLMELINTNFTGEDQIIHLTYGPGNQPESKEAAEKQLSSWLRKVRRVRAKRGLPPLKYICVTEGGDYSERLGRPTKIHHHVIVNGGIDRDELELLWNTKPVKLDKAAKDPEYRATLERTMIGYANTRRLQPGENGLEALAKYLSKDPKGKKRWTSSQNLEKPVRITRDRHYSNRRYEKACSGGEIYDREWWEKHYKGYTLAGASEIAVEAEAPDEINGWRVYAKLRKINNQNRRN